MRGQETLAAARGVSAQDARVRAAARADDPDARDARSAATEEADLGARRGIGGAGER